jgi:hypothetical protein
MSRTEIRHRKVQNLYAEYNISETMMPDKLNKHSGRI